MSRRVRTCVVAVLACAGLLLLVGCGKKKQEGAQSQIDTTDAFPGEDTVGLSDTASGKTLEDVEQYLDSKPQGSAMAATQGEFVESGRYTIQISSSRFERSSQKLVDKLKEQNLPAYLAEVENPTSDLLGTYYRVRIGYFGGVASARSYGPTLAGMGYDWWVDNRSNDNMGSGEAVSAPTPSSSGAGTDMGFGSSSSYESSGASTPSTPAPSTAPAASSTPSTGTTSAPADFGSGTTSGTDWGTSTDTAGSGWQ